MKTEENMDGMDNNGHFNNDFNDIAKSILLSTKENGTNKYGYLDNDKHKMQCNEITPPLKKNLPELPDFFKNKNFILLFLALFFYNLFSYYLVYIIQTQTVDKENNIYDVVVLTIYHIVGIYPHYFYKSKLKMKNYIVISFFLFLIVCYYSIMYAGTKILPKYMKDAFGNDFIKNGYLFGVQFFVLFPSILFFIFVLLSFYRNMYNTFEQFVGEIVNKIKNIYLS